MKSIPLFIYLFLVTVSSTFAQTERERILASVDSLYVKTELKKACVLSLENKLDSALFYALKSIKHKDFPPEIIFFHPDLGALRNDSAKWSILRGKLFADYLEKNPNIAKPDIACELYEYYALDQGDRSLGCYYLKNYSPIEYEINQKEFRGKSRERGKYVKKLLNKFGWLGCSEVGEKAALGMFYVVQHSDGSRLFKKSIPLIIKSASEGEADKKKVALMIDRLLVDKKGVQVYGTQISQGELFVGDTAWKYYLIPILEKSKLDERQEKIGMFKWSIHEKVNVFPPQENMKIIDRNNGVQYKPIKNVNRLIKYCHKKGYYKLIE